MFPSVRRRIDAQFRWLPKPAVGQTLLDIGCGNGAFLHTAKEAGWRVTGLDPDRKACEIAGKSGLDIIYGGLGVLANANEQFDAITLSHVIEHVHDPQQTFRTIFRLLRPGGILYVQTPNIESRGAIVFRSNWRGIESPRHLVLFAPQALMSILQRSGFIDIKLIRSPDASAMMFEASQRLARGLSPYDPQATKLPLRLWRLAHFCYVPLSRTEFITALARKPQ
jgi:2-polyprenyl-3-methyl-5-hydroxy-6-metoxy-1,4-benzoquinol methylase